MPEQTFGWQTLCEAAILEINAKKGREYLSRPVIPDPANHYFGVVPLS